MSRSVEIKVRRLMWDDLTQDEKLRITAARNSLARHVGTMILNRIKKDNENPRIADSFEGPEGTL